MAGKVAAPGHGGGKRGRLDVTADPNVIPFIDVMLVLLIIFMIAAPIASVDIQVDVPKSKIKPSQRPPKPTWISIQDRGQGVRVFVMEEETQIQDVGMAARDAWAINTPMLDFEDDCLVPDAPVQCRIYIRAESGTAYRNVVRVMNQLQNVGFIKIGLVAEDRRR